MTDRVALNQAQVDALRDLCRKHFDEYDGPPESAVVVRQSGGRSWSFAQNRVTATIYRDWLPVARYDLDTQTTWTRADPWVPGEVPLSRR